MFKSLASCLASVFLIAATRMPVGADDDHVHS